MLLLSNDNSVNCFWWKFVCGWDLPSLIELLEHPLQPDFMLQKGDLLQCLIPFNLAIEN